MRAFQTLWLFAAALAAATSCSATLEPENTMAPSTNAWDERRSSPWEEPAAPLAYHEVGTPALPGRMLDDSGEATCPRDTVACHLPRNWNCCPRGMPCCGPGCCARGFRCADARVGMCCAEGKTLCDGVCVDGGCCGPTGSCDRRPREVCCGGRCVAEGRCRGVIAGWRWRNAATAAAAAAEEAVWRGFAVVVVVVLVNVV
ncbi:hypothetical protein ColKHC_03273 [Colletotrichum higginsianum]|uniref:Uncharacterized protein n=1 Tax=Colletotrichum higginsianum TaxID=80884 RepID=A0A4T0W328_9PEZI|nr:hypothetical protein CH35J_005144 [Colletotrichum higginsianum]GJC94447.1 hypothetical protein ColKHC_03273 [Colletotrichum higginsianum]